MKEQFRIYDGSAESQKAKTQAKSLNGFHPLFTAAARRSIALDSLKIWMLLGFIVGAGIGIAENAGVTSVLLGLFITAIIYFGFRNDVYKKVYDPDHDRGQINLPEGMSWEEAVDHIRRGFANPDVEQVTDTADAMTFYSKKRGTYQLKNTANGLKMTILATPSKSSKKEYLYAVFSSVLLSQVIAILYPEKISAAQVEEEKAAVQKLFGAHKMPLVIELVITAAFVAFAAYMLYPVLYSDSARSKGVSDSHMNGFPAEATVGEVLDDFFSDGKWDNFQQDGATFVRYTGTGADTKNGERVTVSIYFKLKDDGTGEIDRISWNGETLSELEQIGIILTLSNSYCESQGLANSNALDNAFDELENALNGAFSDSSSAAESENITANAAESTVHNKTEDYAQEQTEFDNSGEEIYQNSLAEDIYISIGDYISGNMTGEQREAFQSYGEDTFFPAWQDAMYSDVYRCWGKYGCLDAWNQFCQYLDFYYVIFDGKLLDDYEEYNSIYNKAPAGMETDSEAEPYVEEVIALAEKNNAEMFFN